MGCKRIRIAVAALAMALCALPMTGFTIRGDARTAGLELAAEPAAGAQRVLKVYAGLAEQTDLDALEKAVNDGADDAELKAKTDAVVASAKPKERMNFQIFSDVHMTNQAAYQKYGDTQAALKKALRYVEEHYFDTKMLVVNGDITVNGYTDEHQRYLDAIKDSTIPYIMTTIGNHEYYNLNYSDLETRNTVSRQNYINTVNTYNRSKGLPETETVYFDQTIGGYHFIALGSEGATSLSQDITDGRISKTQLNWFENKLLETPPDEPVFVFLHQPLDGTIDESDEWGIGPDATAKLTAIMENHPNIIFASGHMHNGRLGDGAVCNDGFGYLIDLPAFQYTWDVTGVEIPATTPGVDVGYTVSIYDNKILYTPINFTEEQVLYEYTLCVDRPECEKNSSLYDIDTPAPQKTSDGLLFAFSEPTKADGIRFNNTKIGDITSVAAYVSTDGASYAAAGRCTAEKAGWYKINFETPQTLSHIKLTIEGASLSPDIKVTFTGEDKKDLRTLYKTALSTDTSLMSQSQKETYNNVLAKAKKMLQNPKASLAEIETCRVELDKAIQAKDDGSNGNNGSDSGSTENNKKNGCKGMAALPAGVSVLALPGIFRRRIVI